MPTKSPRINVTVTEEQHALLLELAELQGGSAAGFLRQQLDASTPLLRSVVPLMRRAAEEIELTRSEAVQLLEEPLRMLRQMGLDEQLDLLGEPPDLGSSPAERVQAKRSSSGRAGGKSQPR